MTTKSSIIQTSNLERLLCLLTSLMNAQLKKNPGLFLNSTKQKRYVRHVKVSIGAELAWITVT